jgi:hypothetical protein
MPKPDALFNDLGAPYVGQPPYHAHPKPKPSSEEVPKSTWARLKQENEERKWSRSSVTAEQAARMNREHGMVEEVREKGGKDDGGGTEELRMQKSRDPGIKPCVIL